MEIKDINKQKEKNQLPKAETQQKVQENQQNEQDSNNKNNAENDENLDNDNKELGIVEEEDFYASIKQHSIDQKHIEIDQMEMEMDGIDEHINEYQKNKTGVDFCDFADKKKIRNMSESLTDIRGPYTDFVKGIDKRTIYLNMIKETNKSMKPCGEEYKIGNNSRMKNLSRYTSINKNVSPSVAYHQLTEKLHTNKIEEIVDKFFLDNLPTDIIETYHQKRFTTDPDGRKTVNSYNQPGLNPNLITEQVDEPEMQKNQFKNILADEHKTPINPSLKQRGDIGFLDSKSQKKKVAFEAKSSSGDESPEQSPKISVKSTK